MKKTTAYLVALLLLWCTVQASANEKIKGLFNKADQEQFVKIQASIDEAELQIKQAEALFQQADKLNRLVDCAVDPIYVQQMHHSSVYCKMQAINMQFGAADDLEVAHRGKFELYKKYFAPVHNEVDRIRLVQGQEIEKESSLYYRKALEKRNMAVREDDEKGYRLLMEAYELERIALSKQEEAYYFYLDWVDDPSAIAANSEMGATEEYDNYKYLEAADKAVETDAKAPVESARVYKVQLLAVQSAMSKSELEKIYAGSEVIYEEFEGGWYKYFVGAFNDYNAAKALQEKIGKKGTFVVKKAVTDEKPKAETVAKSSADQGVVYRLQIAATDHAIPNADLKKLNHYNEVISIDEDKGWYRYSIGNFKTKEEALAFKKKSDMKGAFVVAYHNGIRVSSK